MNHLLQTNYQNEQLKFNIERLKLSQFSAIENWQHPYFGSNMEHTINNQFSKAGILNNVRTLDISIMLPCRLIERNAWIYRILDAHCTNIHFNHLTQIKIDCIIKDSNNVDEAIRHIEALSNVVPNIRKSINTLIFNIIIYKNGIGQSYETHKYVLNKETIHETCVLLGHCKGQWHDVERHQITINFSCNC